MAPKHDIIYMRFDTDGNLAMKPQQPKPFGITLKLPLPEENRKKLVIRVDAVAIFGTMVALAMLVCMVIGLAKLQTIRQENQKLQSYVQQIQEENQALRMEYQNGYDLDAVKKEALSMGMVPVSDATRTQISLDICKEPPQKGSLLEQVYAFLTGPFA